MEVGSLPKRRERVGMPVMSLQGCIHGVSQNKTPDSKHTAHYCPNLNSIVCRALCASGFPFTIFGRNFHRCIA